jgi:hypothetical protein
MDWEDFKTKLGDRLDARPYPEDIRDKMEFHEVLSMLQSAIKETIKECVPRCKITPYTKWWWDDDLKEKRAIAHRLGKCSYNRRAHAHDPVHEEYRQARNRYSNSIKMAKDKCWETWLASIDDYKMWHVHTYISTPSTDASRMRVPTLSSKGLDRRETKATTNDKKTEMFKLEFFPTAPEEMQVDEDEHKYLEPSFQFAPITDKRIYDTIAKLEPYKALDTDEFLNAVLINCAKDTVPRLGPLYRAVHKLRYWPDE